MKFFKSIKPYWHFARDLHGFLQNPITLEYSERIIQERLNNRESKLLKLVKNAVYEKPGSPYLALLKMAGCEYGDFEKLVLQDGIEATLTKLRRNGVYVSIEEFKGKKKFIRGNHEFKFNESDFDNPYIEPHLGVSTGGSQGTGRRLYYDLDFLTYGRSVYLFSLFNIWDVLNKPRIIWSAILPAPGLLEILAGAKTGYNYVKWYSPIRSNTFKPSLKNRLGTEYIIYTSKLYGSKLPAPEYVTIDEAWKIAEEISISIREHGACFVNTNPSRAVAICTTAQNRGIDISGTKFLLGAEPSTESKRQIMESAGASVLPKYVFTEGGYVGFGCFAPQFADEIHFFKDILALIQYRTESYSGEMASSPFLFTSLSPLSPKILFNVENGDCGVITRRKCGCPFEQLGFTDHIHSIRSMAKLTSQGLTLFRTDVIRIVEDILPNRFGGTSIDYQILEEEEHDGHSFITIVARPELGDLDENSVVEVVLNEIRKGNDAYRMAAELWSQTKSIRVKRMNPVTTPGAKLLPVYTLKAK